MFLMSNENTADAFCCCCSITEEDYFPIIVCYSRSYIVPFYCTEISSEKILIKMKISTSHKTNSVSLKSKDEKYKSNSIKSFSSFLKGILLSLKNQGLLTEDVETKIIHIRNK